MGYKETMKQFWVRHLQSFVKTYITVALGIYLTLTGFLGDINELDAIKELNITDLDILTMSLKGGLMAVLRNLYKMLTEN